MSAHTDWCSGEPFDCTPHEDTHATHGRDVAGLDSGQEASVWVAAVDGEAAVWVAMPGGFVRLDGEHAELLARELTDHAARLREITR